jgi:DNA-binding NtrC family response regulator
MAVRKSKILLVDDDEAERADLQAAAAGQGDLETANSAQEAIAKLGTEAFDLVVTDLVMNNDETAGLQVLSATKREVPVIVVTRYPSQGRSRTAMARGAFDFLDRSASGVDPFEMLKYKITQALELSKARQQIHAGEFH